MDKYAKIISKFSQNSFTPAKTFHLTHKMMLSKTLGVGSSCLHLKEALHEKIPLYHDLLREFRKEHDSATISHIKVQDLYSGLHGVKTLVKETSEMSPKSGITYRGFTMPEVLDLLPRRGQFPSVESVFWLLVTGNVPTEAQTSSLVADWSLRRQRRSIWFSDCQAIVKSLPPRLGPLTKLMIVLVGLSSTDKHVREARKSRFMPHQHWEHTFEDAMDLLACLPSFSRIIKSPGVVAISMDQDWVDLLLEVVEAKGSSAEDFLRLFLTLNADQDGGMPSAHISQIVGSSQDELGKVLAASFLAGCHEPMTGTLAKCEDLLDRVQRLLGQNPKKKDLKDLLRAIIDRSGGLPGFRISKNRDIGYETLEHFSKTIFPRDHQLKISSEIANVAGSLPGSNEGRWTPEQNILATPLLKLHGMNDMEFNQTMVLMSRALGAIASTIWARVINLPVEKPTSSSTKQYYESITNQKKK